MAPGRSKRLKNKYKLIFIVTLVELITTKVPYVSSFSVDKSCKQKIIVMSPYGEISLSFRGLLV